MLKMNDVWVGRYLDMLCVHRAHVRASVGSGNEAETIAQVWTNKNRIVSAFSKLGKMIPSK